MRRLSRRVRAVTTQPTWSVLWGYAMNKRACRTYNDSLFDERQRDSDRERMGPARCEARESGEDVSIFGF